MLPVVGRNQISASKKQGGSSICTENRSRYFLQNILGIIDGGGSLVVKCKQTAYRKRTCGECLLFSASNGTNPTFEEFYYRLIIGGAAGILGGRGLQNFEAGIGGIVRLGIIKLGTAISNLMQAIGASNSYSFI